MDKISDYSGTLLGHVAALYRPGERDLAVEFVEALGCVSCEMPMSSDSGSRFVAVHPSRDDRDPLHNVVYLAEMMPEQVELGRVMRSHLEAHPDLREAAEAYDQAMHRYSNSMPHFGLNFPSPAALQPVLDRLAGGLRPELAERVRLGVVHAGDPRDEKGTTIAFVHTDVLTTGSGCFPQLIELQGRSRDLPLSG